MFIGRTTELGDLNRRYQTAQFQFAVIYGRRRVGKTTLINEFVKGKESIVYTATETNAKQNLAELSQSIYALTTEFQNSTGSMATLKDALETVFRIAQTRRLILVIDEYPYLAACSKGSSSILQRLIDEYASSSKLFLILCGSSMSFMENQVMGYQSPLYGRRTCQYKILPFTFAETRQYYKGFSDTDLAFVYGITGGIPLYMSFMDENTTVRENILHNFLTPNAYLFEEPTNLIKQECRDASQYNSIIGAIASGASRLSEICGKTDLDTSLVSNYIERLIGLGIVRRETPYGVPNSRKPLYLLEDSMFRFWYRFVQGNASAIQRGMAQAVYQRIEPQFSDYMGSVFEEICKQHLWALLAQNKAPIPFTDIGRWWGTDPKRRTQVEIDIVGTADASTALFGECKWTNEKIDLGILQTLQQRSTLFPYKDVHLVLFAKSGFTKGCAEQAEKMGNTTLIPYSAMV